MHRLYRLAGVAILAAGSMVALANDKLPAPAAGTAHTLDLSAPPINLVLTPQQIQSMVVEPDDPTPSEDVTVKTPVYEAPVPTGTFRALPWALMHPLEAWKIFSPITDD